MDTLVQLLTQQQLNNQSAAQMGMGSSTPIQATIASATGNRSHSVGCPWIIDSGTSDHMTYNSNLFYAYHKFNVPKLVTIANGISLKVIGKGDIKLTNRLFLLNMLHVPQLNFNLISISRLTHDNDCWSLFSSSECFF